jgi:hypothetical protein
VMRWEASFACEALAAKSLRTRYFVVVGYGDATEPFASFFALFAARFSSKLFCGSFLVCFLLSMPLLMIFTPHFND